MCRELLHCVHCGEQLEVDQSGLCDDCQERPANQSESLKEFLRGLSQSCSSEASTLEQFVSDLIEDDAATMTLVRSAMDEFIDYAKRIKGVAF